MSGKDYLKRIKMIDTQMKNKSIEAEQLKEVSETLAKKVSAEVEELFSERAKIIKTIEQLSEVEYDVLYKIYVWEKTLYEIAADRDMSYSNVATIHGRALKRLENLIND